MRGKMQAHVRLLTAAWQERLEAWIARALNTYGTLPAVTITEESYGRLAVMAVTKQPAPEHLLQTADAVDTSCVPQLPPERLCLRWRNEELRTTINWLERTGETS